MNEKGQMVKVFFSLECEDDWPPVAVESVWAKPTSESRHYILLNTPFFVHEATLGDEIVAERRSTSNENEAEKLWFCERFRWGGNALIRLIFRREEARNDVVAWLQGAGCICEGFDRFAMVAVSIPPEVEQASIQTYLLDRESAGDVYVEEAMLRP